MSAQGTEFRGRVSESRQALRTLFGTNAGDGVALPELLDLPRGARVSGQGFYLMTAEQYHDDPCPEPSLSASFAAAIISTTPAHARLLHPRLNPEAEDEKAEHFDIGSCAHAAFLEGRDVVKVLDFPDWRTKAAREARSLTRAEGHVPLLRHVWANVEAMLNATRPQLDAHEDGAEMFRDGIAEPVMVWCEDGIWFRSRLDYLRVTARQRFAIDDYKTVSTSADPETLSNRAVWEHGWDVKAAFYRRGLHHLTGHAAEFRFAVQETYQPFALSVVAPSPGAEMLGDIKVQLAIDEWRTGLRENRWRAYPHRTAYFEVPAWMEKRWADREVRDGV